MALTKTDIINKALTYVGAAPVVSIDDTTNSGLVLTRVFEGDLRHLLSECKWNFATKRSNLATSSTTMSWYDVGEGLVYDRPTDTIRIYGSNPATARWREEGNYIISDSSGLGLRYVYYVTDTTLFPAYFLEALIDKLCASIAYAVVNSATLAEKYLNKYTKFSLPNAISANSQTGVQQTIQDDAWELAKYQNIQSDA